MFFSIKEFDPPNQGCWIWVFKSIWKQIWHREMEDFWTTQDMFHSALVDVRKALTFLFMYVLFLYWFFMSNVIIFMTKPCETGNYFKTHHVKVCDICISCLQGNLQVLCKYWILNIQVNGEYPPHSTEGQVLMMNAVEISSTWILRLAFALSVAIMLQNKMSVIFIAGEDKSFQIVENM